MPSGHQVGGDDLGWSDILRAEEDFSRNETKILGGVLLSSNGVWGGVALSRTREASRIWQKNYFKEKNCS